MTVELYKISGILYLFFIHTLSFETFFLLSYQLILFSKNHSVSQIGAKGNIKIIILRCSEALPSGAPVSAFCQCFRSLLEIEQNSFSSLLSPKMKVL